jgi:hypothetical protein
MPRFHHANLGVRPDQEAAEHAFLVEVLGYRRLDPPTELAGRAQWFGSDDGVEIHLSVDAEHRPARMAHTAVEIDDDVVQRLEQAGIPFRRAEFGDLHLVLCEDPAGNRWELRVASVAGDGP